LIFVTTAQIHLELHVWCRTVH